MIPRNYAASVILPTLNSSSFSLAHSKWFLGVVEWSSAFPLTYEPNNCGVWRFICGTSFYKEGFVCNPGGRGGILGMLSDMGQNSSKTATTLSRQPRWLLGSGCEKLELQDVMAQSYCLMSVFGDHFETYCTLIWWSLREMSLDLIFVGMERW